MNRFDVEMKLGTDVFCHDLENKISAWARNKPYAIVWAYKNPVLCVQFINAADRERKRALTALVGIISRRNAVLAQIRQLQNQQSTT